MEFDRIVRWDSGRRLLKRSRSRHSGLQILAVPWRIREWPCTKFRVDRSRRAGHGGPLTDIRDSLDAACKRAGVPRIHVHGLRHTFGSQMAMAGADPFAIMKGMGHADIKTTMIYVSLGKSHIREQVERLNGVYTVAAGRLTPNR